MDAAAEPLHLALVQVLAFASGYNGLSCFDTFLNPVHIQTNGFTTIIENVLRIE